MNEQRNNGRGIFYGVIGVATLVVAIIGATFAYFTATQNVNNVITGNMATVTFGLKVKKVTRADEQQGGMIPMSNSMVESALSKDSKSDSGGTETDGKLSGYEICTDDNGNAVCQIYKIVVNNGGTASMFLDGYVSLTGGSGAPTDAGKDATNETTMRWAQAFCTEEGGKATACTTVGRTTTGATSTPTTVGIGSDWVAISKAEAAVSENSGYNNEQIVTNNAMSSAQIGAEGSKTSVVAEGTIQGNKYDIINTNYIRISDHSSASTTYKRTTDMTSALVLNQYIGPQPAGARTDEYLLGLDKRETDADLQVYYIVVWLAETGTNQTKGADGAAETTANFFQGDVTFISAQGSEVTATFSGYAQVQADTTKTPTP